MKTDSIRDILESKYGNKNVYSLEELEMVETIVINRFNIVNELNYVDFNELLLFNNLKELTINKCIIDENIMNIMLNIASLNKLILSNCEFVANPDFLFESLNVDFLVIDNTMFDLKFLEKCNINSLVLSNIDINDSLNLTLKKLDVSKANLFNYDFLNNKIETLIVSETQYDNNDVLLHYLGHLIIMESNGQMIKKEVNK